MAITYNTSAEAGALFWIEGEKPFMFSQSKPSWRVPEFPAKTARASATYEATVKVPSDLMALMSAENPAKNRQTACTTLAVEQPILLT